jgi:hypothetical protein
VVDMRDDREISDRVGGRHGGQITLARRTGKTLENAKDAWPRHPP